MQLFSADATMFSKKIFFFLPTKSWKNLPQKLLIIGPNLFSHSPAQATANSPKSIFHIIKMSHQTSVLLSVPSFLLCNNHHYNDHIVLRFSSLFNALKNSKFWWEKRGRKFQQNLWASGIIILYGLY